MGFKLGLLEPDNRHDHECYFCGDTSGSVKYFAENKQNPKFYMCNKCALKYCDKSDNKISTKPVPVNEKNYKYHKDIILDFISRFTYKIQIRDINTIDDFQNVFGAGYCWHFAHLLKNIFDGGEVCLAVPLYHFVWVYDNIAYDIYGQCNSMLKLYIPESYLTEGQLFEFKQINIPFEKHMPVESTPLSKKDYIALVEKYCKDTNQVFHSEIINQVFYPETEEYVE